MPIDIAFKTPGALTATVRNDMSEVRPLARAVNSYGLRNNIPAGVIYRINLALEELLANVIRFGYGESDDCRKINVGVVSTGAAIVVRVEDDAIAFDPLTAPQPDIGAAIEMHPRQGLGIHLVRSIMDSIVYRRRGDLNCLTFLKVF